MIMLLLSRVGPSSTHRPEAVRDTHVPSTASLVLALPMTLNSAHAQKTPAAIGAQSKLLCPPTNHTAPTKFSRDLTSAVHYVQRELLCMEDMEAGRHAAAKNAQRT